MIRRKIKVKIHQCEICDRWRASGMMISAGSGPMRAGRFRHRVFKWVCADCQRNQENVQSVYAALSRWEKDHDYAKG